MLQCGKKGRSGKWGKKAGIKGRREMLCYIDEMMAQEVGSWVSRPKKKKERKKKKKGCKKNLVSERQTETSIAKPVVLQIIFFWAGGLPRGARGVPSKEEGDRSDSQPMAAILVKYMGDDMFLRFFWVLLMLD